LLRSKLRQAGTEEETAFVPQACITARKTLKTGSRDAFVVDDNQCFYGIKAVFSRG
jgi:hypothetical protein